MESRAVDARGVRILEAANQSLQKGGARVPLD